MAVTEPLTACDALLLVDVQNDFLPGGALAVPDGDAVVPVLGRYIAWFHQRQKPIYVSRDWHPADHCSFVAQGGDWPAHCVQNTLGAAFASGMELPADAVVISKADLSTQDAYSAFSGTDLARRLQVDGVRSLAVGGLATDYCVRATVLDALEAGLTVYLLTDAIRAVELNAGDGDRAIVDMLNAGARRLDWDKLATLVGEDVDP